MCYNGIVYDRRVKGRPLTLAVSGMLWEHSLVMIDKETRSYWSHLPGKAMRGELTGSVLKTIPSVITDWKTWIQRYPDSTAAVMSRTAQEYRSTTQVSDQLLLIGLALEGLSRAWNLQSLRDHPVVNDRLGDVGVLVVFDASSGTTVLHGRRVDHQDFTFEWKDGTLLDQETGSAWDLITGEAVQGPLKGRRLPLLPGTISSSHAWMTFHSKSTYWQP